MSKAFTIEDAGSPDDDFVPQPYRSNELPLTSKNYTTPPGYRRLLEEFEQLSQKERPAAAALVSHAAATSQNLDLQTHKRRLREIDWRIQYLQQRIDRADIIDPAARKPVDQVFFGATVTYVNSQHEQRTVSIVGVEEADVTRGLISFVSPLGKALLRSCGGDVVQFERPDGAEELEIVEVTYREIGSL
jgi:transcription elongation factor GreB